MPLEVPLTDGTVAVVDNEDAWVLDYRWGVRADTQTVFALKPHPPGGNILRRLIMGVEKGGYVSHIDGDQRNCRRSNLTTVHPNAAPRLPEAEDPIRVIKDTEGRAVATILVNGHRQYVGTFDTPVEAEVRANQALRKLGKS